MGTRKVSEKTHKRGYLEKYLGNEKNPVDTGVKFKEGPQPFWRTK
jgi:hypothetical protein